MPGEPTGIPGTASPIAVGRSDNRPVMANAGTCPSCRNRRSLRYGTTPAPAGFQSAPSPVRNRSNRAHVYRSQRRPVHAGPPRTAAAVGILADHHRRDGSAQRKGTEQRRGREAAKQRPSHNMGHRSCPLSAAAAGAAASPAPYSRGGDFVISEGCSPAEWPPRPPIGTIDLHQ